MDFTDYNLGALRDNPALVYEIGNGVIPEMASMFGCSQPNVATSADLFRLVRAVGPEKELQRNIDHVLSTFAAIGYSYDDAVRATADWLERTGTMNALYGSFWNPSNPAMPDKFDATVWSGGVANWLFARLMETVQTDSQQTGQVLLPMGTRVMRPEEHQLVTTFARLYGQVPTEFQFTREYVLPLLRQADFDTEILETNSANGDEVCDAVFARYPSLLSGTILVIGNAPNTIQAAAQMREAARRANPSFDAAGSQMFVRGTSFPIARNGEPKRSHQNPLSGIGQIARNAALLLKSAGH